MENINSKRFQRQTDDVSLEIEDTSHKSYKLIFKNGAKFHMFRVTGTYFKFGIVSKICQIK